MSKERLPESVRTRVSRGFKKALAAIAEALHLDESDIQREAFRDFIGKPENQKLLEPLKLAGKKDQVYLGNAGFFRK